MDSYPKTTVYPQADAHSGIRDGVNYNNNNMNLLNEYYNTANKTIGLTAREVQEKLSKYEIDKDYEYWSHITEQRAYHMKYNVELEATNSGVQLPLYVNTQIAQQPANMTAIPQYYTANALQFINNAVMKNQPFFLYMAYHETHHPQFASQQFFNTTQRGQFGDAISELDFSVGVIMGYLETLGIEEDTIVFFFSDNGGSLKYQGGGNNGHLKCGKGTTWEGGIRVPGMVRWTSHLEAGRVTRQLGSLLDVLPTIADIIGYPLNDNITYDGISMYNWLFDNKGNGGKSSRNTFWYWPGQTNYALFNWTHSLRGVRVNQYKLHWTVQGAICENYYADHDCRKNNTAHMLQNPLLYNLYHDPSEHYPLKY